MARAIGVDIGDHTIKVVELGGSARSFKVQRVAIRPVPEDDEPEGVTMGDDEGDDAPPKLSRTKGGTAWLRHRAHCRYRSAGDFPCPDFQFDRLRGD